MSNLRQSLKAEVQEKKEIAKQKITEAKDKMITRYEEISHNTRERVRKVKEAFIGTKEEAHESQMFQTDYEYIGTGYRVNHHSCKELLKSLFTCHNETVNIWSHLFGVILFALICFILLFWINPQQLRTGHKLIQNFEDG